MRLYLPNFMQPKLCSNTTKINCGKIESTISHYIQTLNRLTADKKTETEEPRCPVTFVVD